MSSSSTTACSRSPSPSTPEGSDNLDPAITQEVVNAWCHSLTQDGYLISDDQFLSADKEGRAPALDIGDLIQEDAYDEYVNSGRFDGMSANEYFASPVRRLQHSFQPRDTFILCPPVNTILCFSYGKRAPGTQSPKAPLHHEAGFSSSIANSPRTTSSLSSVCRVPYKRVMFEVCTSVSFSWGNL